jgi:hypothetical protein
MQQASVCIMQTLARPFIICAAFLIASRVKKKIYLSQLTSHSDVTLGCAVCVYL